MINVFFNTPSSHPVDLNIINHKYINALVRGSDYLSGIKTIRGL